MTEAFMKSYRLKITTYSPVHIGDSRDLEPTEYVIYSEKASPSLPRKQESACIICPECGYKNPVNARTCGSCDSELPRQTLSVQKPEPVAKPDSYLYTFTPAQLSAALSDADKKILLKEADKGDLTTLQRFFKNKAAAIAKTAAKRAFVGRQVADKYEKSVGQISSKSNDSNKFFIEKQISDAVTGLPYIPGSSLKGAIRTALMSAKNKRSQLNKALYKKKGADAEKALYGYDNPTNDPFKALKLEDGIAVSPFMTEIGTAENVKRTVKQKGRTVFIETVPPKTVFESSLTFSFASNDACRFGETIASVRSACNDFYFDILNDGETAQVNTHGIDSSLFSELEKIKQKRNAFLLCLGKHGGAESKTIDGLRNIRITGKGNAPMFLDHATTYYGKERLPFGWCVVEFEEMK